jgi:tripartite-type tricarboxylate transporter receptor subunit TctC
LAIVVLSCAELGHATLSWTLGRSYEIDFWIGLFAPAKTPPAIVARLQQEIAQASTELKPRFEGQRGELMTVPPERLKEFVATEHARWLKLIQEAGIRLD